MRLGHGDAREQRYLVEVVAAQVVRRQHGETYGVFARFEVYATEVEIHERFVRPLIGICGNYRGTIEIPAVIDGHAELLGEHGFGEAPVYGDHERNGSRLFRVHGERDRRARVLVEVTYIRSVAAIYYPVTRIGRGAVRYLRVFRLEHICVLARSALCRAYRVFALRIKAPVAYRADGCTLVRFGHGDVREQRYLVEVVAAQVARRQHGETYGVFARYEVYAAEVEIHERFVRPLIGICGNYRGTIEIPAVIDGHAEPIREHGLRASSVYCDHKRNRGGSLRFHGERDRRARVMVEVAYIRSVAARYYIVTRIGRSAVRYLRVFRLEHMLFLARSALGRAYRVFALRIKALAANGAFMLADVHLGSRFGLGSGSGSGLSRPAARRDGHDYRNDDYHRYNYRSDEDEQLSVAGKPRLLLRRFVSAFAVRAARRSARIAARAGVCRRLARFRLSRRFFSLFCRRGSEPRFVLFACEDEGKHCHHDAGESDHAHRHRSRGERYLPPGRYLDYTGARRHAVHRHAVKLIIQYSVARLAESEHDRRIVFAVFEIRFRTVRHPQIVARDETFRLCPLVSHMERVARAGVSLHHADEIPFVAEDVGEQTLVRARPGAAYAVERTHHAVHVPLSYRYLERAEVYLSRALFVEEGRHAVTVALLIVESKVLGHDHDALALQSRYFRAEYLAGQEAVLAVILPVSAAVKRAVYVRAGRV